MSDTKPPKKPVPKIRAFVNSLPGRTIELFYATNEFQLRGYTFVVDIVDWDEDDLRFAIKPVNQGPFVCFPYGEIILLTNDRIIINGGQKETDTEWTMRIEARDLPEQN